MEAPDSAWVVESEFGRKAHLADHQGKRCRRQGDLVHRRPEGVSITRLEYLSGPFVGKLDGKFTRLSPLIPHRQAWWGGSRLPPRRHGLASGSRHPAHSPSSRPPPPSWLSPGPALRAVAVDGEEGDGGVATATRDRLRVWPAANQALSAE